MKRRRPLGGIIHTYQKYDPRELPGPFRQAPDMVSGAFEHMLMFGELRELTDEELARAVRLDPSQIAGLGPSLEALMQLLRERKRKILETYETERVQNEAAERFAELARRMRPPGHLRRRFEQAVRTEQLYDLERLWYRTGDERSRFARQLVQLIDRLGDKYQIDELAARYHFTGRRPMTIPEALEIKRELEEIDRLLKQLEEAARTAQIGVIDLNALSDYAEPGDIEKLNELGRQIEQYLRDLAEQQGLERTRRGYRLTPKAYRLFQARLLERIFSNLQPSRTGRHTGPVVGEGAVELQQTRPYEFGDSLAHMDISGSMLNAMVRNGPGLPIRLKPEDIQVHRAGYERLDALRRTVRGRETHGTGPGRPDSPRIPGRFSALCGGLYLRPTARCRRDRQPVAAACDAGRSGGGASAR